ncbi:MAG TPA: pyruvate kinase [Candidatus Thermoplasmatota archaeon]
MAAKPRTKIVATIGPSCDTPAIIERMLRAGMTVARLNFAHGGRTDHQRRVDLVRGVSERVGINVAVMGDIAGPKLRIGELEGGRVTLQTGQRVVLTSKNVLGTAERLSVTEPRVIKDIRPGEPVFLADGSLELKADHVSGGDVECRILNGGLLLPRKGVNLPRTKLRLPALTEKDEADLKYAVRAGFDALALSFVRDVKDLKLAKQRLGSRQIPIIAKIEKREAIHQLPAILDASDGAMVARGDLGVETSYDEVPLLQKRIIRLANNLGKPVVTATQMLKSMVEAPHPTRAEAADVANAILDGTDAVMLSEETAMGKYPAQSVETMARIARRTETAIDPEFFAQRSETPHFVAGAVSESAVRVARATRAAAIVTPTAGGATPRFVARLRPGVPIVALTRRLPTARFLQFSWGVEPLHTPNLGSLDTTIRFGIEHLKRHGLAKVGDRVVFTAGFPPEGQSSNLMTVQEVR